MATPALRVRIAPKFPSKVQGSGGVTVTRTGGTTTIDGASLRPFPSLTIAMASQIDPAVNEAHFDGFYTVGDDGHHRRKQISVADPSLGDKVSEDGRAWRFDEPEVRPAQTGVLASPNIAPAATYPSFSPGSGDQQPALQAWLSVPGYKKIGSGRRTYRLDSGLIIPNDLDALKLDLGNTVFDCSRFATSTKALDVSGVTGAARPLAADVTKGDLSISLSEANRADLTPGMLVLIGSNALFDPGSTSSRLGELTYIESVDSPCTLKMPLRDSYAVADSAFLMPIYNPMAGFELIGGEFYGPEASENECQGIRLSFMENPKVHGGRFNYLDFVNLAFVSCVRGEADVTVTMTRPNVTGYGVSFLDACLGGVSRGLFREVRHAASTNNNVSTGWGVVRDITFRDMQAIYSAVAAGGSMIGGSTFDTHTAAENISFIDCVSQGSNGQALNIECPTAMVRGFRAYDARSTLVAALCNNLSGRAGHYILSDIMIDGSAGTGLTVQKASGGPQTTFDLSSINIRRTTGHCVTLQRVDGGSYRGGVLQPPSGSRAINIANADRLTIGPYTCLGGLYSTYLASSVTNSFIYRGADTSTNGVLMAGTGNTLSPPSTYTQTAVVSSGAIALSSPDIRRVAVNVTSGPVTLTSVTGAVAGQMVAFSPSTNDNALTISEGGNFQTIGSADQVLSGSRDTVLFMFSGTEWRQLAAVAENA
jgi:hypothetical protein